MLKVIELRFKVFLMKDIGLNDSLGEICNILDKSFLEDNYQKFHTENTFKNYSVGGFLPIEKDRIFKNGKIYTFTVRSVDEKLTKHFQKIVVNLFTDKIKVLTVETKVLKRGRLEKIYTLTPTIAKFEGGYWDKVADTGVLETRIKVNLLKKYKVATGKTLSIDETCFFDMVSIDNKYPIPFKYKTIKYLGDKFTFHIKDTPLAQELAYFAMGVGILEMNPRGAGFVGYLYTNVGEKDAK